MGDKASIDPAVHLLRVALSHPECVDAAVLEPSSGRQRIRIDMNVEMPLHRKADGISGSGVRTCEPVEVELPSHYPWQSPRFYLREDFPRNFPHLMPFSRRPQPCLVDGDQDEYFLQFGLVEYGIFQLVGQLAAWLRKAAAGGLIDPHQGWEPMLRRELHHVILCDAERVRRLVNKQGGWVAWQARFVRRGAKNNAIGDGSHVWLSSEGKPTPLTGKPGAQVFTSNPVKANTAYGNTVVAIIWPDKHPDGSPFVSTVYMPETVRTLADLCRRADDLGCGRSLGTVLSNLERCFKGRAPSAPVPVGVVLCVRRPVHLIGETSDIELLPYVFEIPATEKHTSLFPHGDMAPVGAAMHYQSLTQSLLRRLSGLSQRPSMAFLGCGSLGSKLALHAARAGQSITAVCDQALLRPHNMARHALEPDHIAHNKAEALAEELAGFDISPEVYIGDLISGLTNERDRIIPKATGVVVNSTASLAVREALVATADRTLKARLLEIALFGRGKGAFLLMDGAAHNPTHSDLIAELYATLADPRTTQLLLDPDEGLTAIQVGQGCGSLTMPMEDARLSAMAAGLSLELDTALTRNATTGLIVKGVCEENSASTHWSQQIVHPFQSVEIAGSDGWELRLSQRVVDRLKAEVARYHGLETGGVMIGLTSARLKTVTVVDLLEAPTDSQRSPTLFVLGTSGLHRAIEDRHADSGRTLFDVGTWHSHLEDVGPSQIDWETAAALSAERAPPSVLLIATPSRFIALRHQ